MPLTKKLQEVVDHISHDRQALLDSTSVLSETQLDYKPTEGEWSISDILHHLALADEANFKLASNILKQAEAKGLPPDPTPDASMLGSLDHFVPKLGGKFQAPDRVAPRSYIPAVESIAKLQASRENLFALLEELARYDLSEVVYPHPLLGDLNAYQWFMMAGRHEDRHLAQIARIKAASGFPGGQ